MSEKTVERLQVVIEATSKPLRDEMKKIRASIKESTKGIEEQKAAMKKSMDEQMAPIRKVREQMKRFSESVKNVCKVETPAGQFKNMEKEINATEKQLQKLLEKRERLERSGKNIEMTQEYKEVQKAVSDAEKQLNRYIERQDKMRATGVKESSKSWKNLEYDIEQARNSVREAKIDLENMSSADKFQNTEEWKELNREISKVKTNLAQCHAKQEEFEKNTKVNRISRAYSGLKGTLKDTNNGIKKGSGLFAALIQKFKTGIPWLNKTKSSMRGLGNEGRGLGGMFRTLGMTARFMFTSFLLQSVIGQVREGFKNLAKYSNEYGTQFNSSITLMYSSLKQLQNALATAFEPIVNVVAPYITTLIQHLTAGANALAQFFSALTGSKTWTKATYNIQNYADSLDNASESAKKLKNELYGFDEITKQSDTDSSSISSGSGVAAGDMFTEETVKNQFSDFAQMVKDVWKNADFTEVGTTIANKLKIALGKIEWESVYSAAGNFGTGLATFLNGLFSADKDGNTVFGSLGTTIAGVLNTLIYSVFSFSEEFEWADFGQALKDGIQKFINGTELAKAGYTVGNLVKGIATSVYTAVSDVETWKNLGTKIADGINGFLKSMGEVNPATGKNGWQITAATFNSLVDAVIITIREAISGITWEDVMEGVTDFLGELELDTLTIIIGAIAIETGLAKPIFDSLKAKILLALGLTSGQVAIYAGIFVLTATITYYLFENGKPFVDWLKEKIGNLTVEKNTVTSFDGEEVTLEVPLKWKIKSLKWDLEDFEEDLKKKIELIGLKIGAWLEGILDEKLWKLLFGDKSYKKELAELTDSENKNKSGTSGGGSRSITIPTKINPKQLSKDVNTKIDNLNKKGKTKPVTTKVTNDSEKDAEKIQGKTSSSFGKLPGLKTTVKNTTTAKSLHDPLSGYFMRNNLMIGTTNTTDGSELRSPLATFMKEHPLNAKVNNTTKGGTYRKPLADFLKDHPLNAKVNNTTKGKTFRSPLATFMKDHPLNTKVVNITKASTLWGGLTKDWGSPALGVGVQTESASTVFDDFEKDWNNSKKKLIVNGKINFEEVGSLYGKDRFTITLPGNANGGLFKNGSWKPITAFAGGGLPGMGQVFVAREAGPELVGTIGGHTAVMNNNQIVSSVAAGVASAVAGVMSQFSGNSSPEVHVYVGGKEITDYVVKDVNQRTIATGACPIMT